VAAQSLAEVREHIDRIDQQLVALIAERGRWVQQAARFKSDADAVRAPQRVEQVIAKVRALAAEHAADPTVVEAVYRAMIAAFIQAELAEHQRLQQE